MSIMSMKKNTICKYYLLNQCKYGSNCLYLHEAPSQANKPKTVLSSYEDNQSTKQIVPIITPSAVIESKDIITNLFSLNLSATAKNLCSKFFKGNCTDEDCAYYHGYSDFLIHISYIPCHPSNIVSLCSINKDKFASCDDTYIKVWKIEDKLRCIGECNISNGIINQMISADNKLFITVIKPMTINETVTLYTLIESSFTSKSTSMGVVYDMIYFLNMLICFGDDSIEFYKVIDKELMFIKHMKIINAITAVTYVNQCVFCGHMNGQITVLKYDTSDFFKQLSNFNAHNAMIRKMIIKSVNEYSNYLISASEDKSIKVYNIEKGMCVVFTRSYSYCIENIAMTVDAEGNELFCLCFRNGGNAIVNSEFETLFEIDYNGYNRNSFINVFNPDKKENDGDFFIMGYEKKIECNMWIRPGSYNKSTNNNTNTTTEMKSNDKLSFFGI